MANLKCIEESDFVEVLREFDFDAVYFAKPEIVEKEVEAFTAIEKFTSTDNDSVDEERSLELLENFGMESRPETPPFQIVSLQNLVAIHSAISKLNSFSSNANRSRSPAFDPADPADNVYWSLYDLRKNSYFAKQKSPFPLPYNPHKKREETVKHRRRIFVSKHSKNIAKSAMKQYKHLGISYLQ